MKTSVLLLSATVLATALCACGGGGKKTTSTTTTVSSPAGSPGAASPMATQTASSMAKAGGAAMGGHNGGAVYTANCSSCHQSNGKGQPNVFPPLAGNAVVTGDPKKVIHIVKNGLNGKIKVGSMTFNGQMPAWKGTLSNSDIAAVITYIRSSWGNHAGPVSASQVASTP